ncbi:hypothetical protein RvY_14625 [Ramazzottius varieornatus]|uniref:DOMON domain-containing protein n=1 Tax=Ramazzottius varieornatus TaxID=947166 RepID=A0A1D1VX13_RAMVA|nr:hypothetical protein RvY_14625 [Ramazzottius varieornatus]
MRKLSRIFRWNFFINKADWILMKWIIDFLIAVLLNSTPTSHVSAHVVLTYPPARKYALDFLDNVHSPEPCGMPKGLSEPTFLQVGSEIEVTWHSAYPDEGGYAIELLDENYDRVSQLFPVLAGREPRTSVSFENIWPNTTSQTITLPKNVSCDKCTLRITRQARQWENVSRELEGYVFRSCADVNIVDQVDNSQKCSSHGSWTVQQKCNCDDLYTGNVCQYKEICLKEADCNFRGKCIDSGSNSHPKKRCNCLPGWQGRNCSRESFLKTKVFNKALFTHYKLADGFDLYWKIDKNLAEIEFAVQSKSSSWIAIGWRPLTLTGECRQQFPKLANETYSPHGASLLAKELTMDDSEFEAIRPRSGKVSEELDEPLAIRPRREVMAVPQNVTLLDPAVLFNNASEELHPMDCTDIVIGFARNGFGQVQDSYTRDRSTPQDDSFYGGMDNLIGSIAFEEDGVTIMRFKRALAAVDPADHSFLNSPMHVIFARGQEKGSFHHYPPLSMEADNKSLTEFYKPDDLRYHGAGANNRGVALINFFDEKNELATLQSPCVGEWKAPLNCVGVACQYKARWEFLEDSDSIYFNIQAKAKDRWIGIGFNGEENHMPGSDIIIGWVDDDGRVQLTDRHADGHRTPILDKKQDLQNIAGSVDSNFMTIEFTRLRVTNDTNDFQFHDEKCAFFLFPVNGGKFDKYSGVMSKHEFIPTVLPNKVCVQSCRVNGTSIGGSPAALLHDAASEVPSAELENSSLIVPQDRADGEALVVINTTATTVATSVSSSTLATTTSLTSIATTPSGLSNLPGPSIQLPPAVKRFLSRGNSYPVSPTSTTSSPPIKSPPATTQGDITTSSTVTAAVPVSTSAASTTSWMTLPSTTTLPTTKFSSTLAFLDIATTSAITTTTTAPSTTQSTRIIFFGPAASTAPAKGPIALSTTTTTPVTSTARTLIVATTTSTGRPIVTQNLSVTMPTVTTPPTTGAPSVTGISNSEPGGNWTQCYGQWRFPPDCTPANCEYVIMWEYEPSADDIHFYIRSSHPDRWTGVGFSPNAAMPHSDVIFGFVTPDGNVTITDGTTEGHYPPIKSSPSMLTNIAGRVKDGKVELSFTRPRGFDINRYAMFGVREQDCPHFLFPVEGGPFDSTTGFILKHAKTPKISRHRICVKQCSAEDPPAPFTLPRLSEPIAAPLTAPTTPPSVLTTTQSTTTTTEEETTTTQLPVIEGTPCRAIFSFPRDCNTSTCVYVAQWDYLPPTDEINFVIQSNRLNTWTGIGFSDSGEMPYSDMAIGWVNGDGRPTISDRWSTTYAEPQRDFQQDLTHLGGTLRYGTQIVTFTRKRQTGDERDYQFSDTSCPYLIFPVFGGTYDDASEIIDKHEVTPVVSDQRICIRACRQRTTLPPSLDSSAAVLANSSSPVLSTFDQKLLVINPAQLTEAGMTPPPTTTRRPTGAFSNAGSTKTGLVISSVALDGSKTQSPSSASLTYRKKSLQPNSTISIGSSSPATSFVTTTTALPSPEEMLRVMLLQAGLNNVAVQIPANDQPPRFVTAMTPLPGNASSRATANAGGASTTFGVTKSGIEFVVTYPATTVASRSDIPQGNRLGSVPENNNSQNSSALLGSSAQASKPSGSSAVDEAMSQAQLLALAGMVIGNSTLLPPNLTPPPGSVQIGVVLSSPPDVRQESDISVLSSGNSPIEPIVNQNTRVKSSETVVTGFNLGQTPTAGELLVRAKSQNPSIGPLPAASGSPPPAISMTPEQMLQALLKESGMGEVKVEGVDTSPAANSKEPSAPVSGRIRNNAPLRDRHDTVPAAPTRYGAEKQRSRLGGSSGSLGASGSAPVPSIVRFSTALPPVQQKAEVFISAASDRVSSPSGPAPAAQASGLVALANDQGTIGDNEDCGGIFKYPSGCIKEACAYVATWRPGSSVDEIEFSIETDRPDLWSAIGFSDDKLMKGSDIIYGFIRTNGMPRLVEAFAADYMAPVRDFRNEIRVIDGGRTGNRAFFHFARKLTTRNPNNFDFGNGRCPFFKFPVLGGSFDPNTLMIDKHQRTPIVSPTRICLKSCTAPRVTKPPGKVLMVPPTVPSVVRPVQEPVGSGSVERPVVTSASAKNASSNSSPDGSVLSCVGEFRFPDGCTPSTCEYVAQWEYVGPTDEIKFNVISSRPDEWTGIGFNDKRQMPGADILYGWVDPDTAKPTLVDASASAYVTPTRDLRQDGKNVTGKRLDQIMSLSFTRKRSTNDDKDYQFTDQKCPYFVFPIRGGEYDPGSMMIMKHKSTPMVSTSRVCITSACAPATLPPPSALSTPPPNDSLRGPVLMTDLANSNATARESPTTTLPPPPRTKAVVLPPDPFSYMPCEGQWRYPENCVEPNCIYVASWNYLDDADAIRFVVKAKATGWTGIGFNDDMMMAGTDAIIGWVTSKNTVVVTDRHAEGNSGAPMADEQTVYDVGGRREDGYQIIEFTRKRDTQDPNGQHYVFGDQKCPFFIFPVVGGGYDSYGGIQAHSLKAKPKISPQRICVRSCNIDVPRRMVVSFRIVDRSWSPELESRQTAAFKKLEAELADPLGKLFGNTPGYRGSRVIAFRPGSVVADVEIAIDPTANQTSVAGAKIIKMILMNQVQQKQQIGLFAVDPASLSISNAEQIVLSSGTTARTDVVSQSTSNKAPESEVRTYAIIGGVVGLIAILLFLAFGKVWYDRKARLERRLQREQKPGVPARQALVAIGPPQYPRRQSRSSSIEPVRSEGHGQSPSIFPMPTGMRNGSRPDSSLTRTSSANPPPDYYDNDSNGKVSRKTRRTAIADEHPLHRLSTNESDRTFTTYSSDQSRHINRKKTQDALQEWDRVDDSDYKRPPDFYFMPSQRRWTQVPQTFQ